MVLELVCNILFDLYAVEGLALANALCQQAGTKYA